MFVPFLVATQIFFFDEGAENIESSTQRPQDNGAADRCVHLSDLTLPLGEMSIALQLKRVWAARLHKRLCRAVPAVESYTARGLVPHRLSARPF